MANGSKQFLIVCLAMALAGGQGGAQSPNPNEMRISVQDVPSMGAGNAKVAIVEFADYQCPYCIAYANNILPQIIADYVASSKVRYFFKDLPIENLHPDAFKAAEAAHCAGDQGKYWEMHERLFKSGQELALQDLLFDARMLRLDVAAVDACLHSSRHAARIRADIEESKRLGVEGTPTFFIGLLEIQESRMKVTTKIQGTQEYMIFQQALEAAIRLVPAAGGD
jgi:protein-disulfide isomerase